MFDRIKQFVGGVFSPRKEDKSFPATTPAIMPETDSGEGFWQKQKERIISPYKRSYEDMMLTGPELARSIKSFVVEKENEIKNDIGGYRQSAAYMPVIGPLAAVGPLSPLKREETEYRPPYSIGTHNLKLNWVEKTALDTISRLAELPARLLTTPAAEFTAMRESIDESENFDNFLKLYSRKNTEIQLPIDGRRIGFQESTIKTVAGEMQDMIDSGHTYLEAGLLVGGTRTLEVAIGASIINSMSKLMVSKLATAGGPVKRVEAWKELGAPKTIKQLRANYIKKAREFHPDMPMGNETLFKQLQKATQLLVKDKAYILPSRADFAAHQAWRVAEPFSRTTAITRIMKDGPPIIKGPEGVLKINARKWEEIWRDARDFPNRFAKNDLIKTGFQPHELVNTEKLLRLPGYRPVPGQPSPIGLSIQNWERVGGIRNSVAKELVKKWGPERANQIIRFKGEKLLNDVELFGMKQATEKIMLSDVPNVAQPKISEQYNKLREAIQSEQITPIFPKVSPNASGEIQELSPSLFKVAEDSKIAKVDNLLRKAGKEYQKQLVTGTKPDPSLSRKIDALRKRKVEEAKKLGIAIIKDKKGREIPAIRKSGFFASDELMKHEIKNVGSVFTSPLNVANEQDMTFELQEGLFGPMTRTGYYPLKEAEATKTKGIIDTSSKLLETAKANKVKITDKNGEIIFDIWHKVKGDDLAKLSPSQIKAKYPAVEKYSDEIIGVASHTGKEMAAARETNNTLRGITNRDLIGKIEYYGPHVLKTDIYNKIQNDSKFKADPIYDYIVANTTRNPFAKPRLDKIAPEDLEKNAFILYEKYMNAMYNDTYMTPVIEQLKANNMVLKHLGKDVASKYWETIIRQNITKRPGTVDAYFGVKEGTIAKAGLEKIIDARIKASLAGNLLWSITTQPLSYFQLTIKDAGLVNSFAKGPVDWLFNKELRKELVKDHTMVLKEKRAHSAAYQGGLDAYDQSIFKTPIRKASDVLTILTHANERFLTGMSYAALKPVGKQYGYTGEDLMHFASRGAEHTQSLYNRTLRPPVLNETIVRSGFPFQTWGLEHMAHIFQIFGKGKMPAAARVRWGMAINYIIGTLIGNAYIRAIRGYTFTTPGDFVPFVGGGVDYAIDQIFDTDFSYKKRDSIALIEDAAKLGTALGEINQAIQELGSNDYKTTEDLSKALVEYAADGNLDNFRKELVYWASGLSGMGGGVQANRMIDFIIDAERGYAEDMYNREWFPVELRDIPFGILFGKYTTPSAKEAIKEMEEQDKIYEEIQTKDKKEREKEAVRLHNKFKEMGYDDANKVMAELEEYDPLLYRRIVSIKEAEEKDLTKFEAGWLKFNIEGGYRAKALYEYYKDYPEEERWRIFNEYIEKGIITERVREQHRQWYGWGAPKDKPTEPEPKELREWRLPDNLK